MENRKSPPKKSLFPHEVSAIVKTDLKKLILKTGNKAEFKSIMTEQLNSVANPYMYTLDLICHSTEGPKSKLPSVTHMIIKEFEQWHKTSQFKGHLNLIQKKRALDMMMHNNFSSSILQLCRLFDLKSNGRELKEIVDAHITMGHYNQACYVIIALNLQDAYSLGEVIFPLVYLNNIQLVHLYTDKLPYLQMELVKSLDYGCSDRLGFNNWKNSFTVVNLKSSEKRDCAWLRKLLSKLIKTYNISLDDCPNLKRSRGFGAIYYMVHKRYSEKSITDEGFLEMALTTVENDPALKKEILVKLVSYGEYQMALKIAKLSKLSQDKWPFALHMWYRDNTESPDEEMPTTSGGRHWTSCEEDPWVLDHIPPQKSDVFLEFRLVYSDIHVVDTPAKFEKCISDIADGYDIIGIDAEWRPDLGLTNEISRMSLFQLATWDDVYLLDVLTLSNCISSHHWKDLVTKIFCNPKILKLGFGMAIDLKLLVKKCGEEKPTEKLSHKLDLDHFWPELLKKCPTVKAQLLRANKITSQSTDLKGLAKLCHTVLGKALNKEEQFSDWERRPLRTSQIIYAALDAYCLLQIYERLHHEISALNMNLDTIISNFLEHKKKPKADASNNKEATETPEKNSDKKVDSKQVQEAIEMQKNVPKVKAANFKVVVDNHLMGLGKQLRICGIDVVQDANPADFGSIVKTCLNENRVILTSGEKYNKVKGYVPDEMCFDVPGFLVAQEQAKIVCEAFNISITEDDVFTRCTVCNCDHYLNVNRESMQLLWSLHESSNSKTKNSLQNLKPLVQCGGSDFISEDGVINNTVAIQFGDLNPKALVNNEAFLVCSSCGKVYWEGSHHRKAKEAVNELVKNSGFPLQSQKQNVKAHSGTLTNDVKAAQKTVHPKPKQETLNPVLKSTSSVLHKETSELSSCSVEKRLYVYPDGYSDDSENDIDDMYFPE